MTTLPTLFISHGAPTVALEPGLAGAQLRALGEALGKPRAIVVVSPHWMTRGVEVGAAAQPETVHDFGGLSPALYQMRYPAPGAPEVAHRVAAVLGDAGIEASLAERQGLDHGAWVPLLHLYPDADVPVVQISLPAGLDGKQTYALGAALTPLAEEGVLVIGSGSLTHNLYEFRAGTAGEAAYAREFSLWIRQRVLSDDREGLIHALERAPHAQRAHPTAEHFLPLLVALGAARQTLPATVLDGGIRHGVLAMESYVLGRELVLDASEAIA